MSARPIKPRVGFVVCPSFHGATLLALLLNNHSAVSALGDTNPTRRYDQVCACGRKVSVCPFWQTVSARLNTERFGDLEMLLPEVPWPVSNRLEGSPVRISGDHRINRAAGRLAGKTADGLLPLIWRRGNGDVREYLDVWRAFYNLVSELHETTVVVDGSKHTRKVTLIKRALREGADVSVIHLVRDPRGFVASRLRNVRGADLRTSAWLWSDMHRRIADLGRDIPYRQVRYEDLVLRAESDMKSIFEFLGVAPEPVVAPVRFPEKHHLMGNSMLFDFNGTVALDERWRTELTSAQQSGVLAHAGELARHYGYE